MSKKLIVIFSTVGLIGLVSLITLYARNISNQKIISSLDAQLTELNSQVVNLEDELKQSKDQISELDEKLSEVQHFDDDANIGQGFSSSNSGGKSYTGDVLETQIDGEFKGCEGETIFKLMNGTIWQQSSYNYMYHYSYMPKVLIYRKSGVYFMKVEDVEDEIQVKQIK